MKLIFCLLFAVLSLPAFAQWRLPFFERDTNPGGLRAVWSCQTSHRGEMPSEKEVEIYYDDFGTMKFRPDIFKLKFNPLNEVNNLIGRKRESTDVDECLRSFLKNLPRTIETYQASQCEGLTILSCSRKPAQIFSDLQTSIRNSNFYNKYNSQLSGMSELITRPQEKPVTVVEEKPETVIVESTTPEEPTVTPEVPTENPEVIVTETPGAVDPAPEVVTTPTRPVPEVPEVTVREEIPRPTADVDRARTRLLDYMVDNSSRIERLKDFAKFCPDLGATAGVNASYCSQTMSLNNDFLNRVSQMFTSLRGEPVSVSRVVQSLECLPPSLNEFADIEGILRRMDSREECSPLPTVGDFKLFKKQQSPPAWYTTGNYLLKKTGDNAYEATLTLDFTNMGGSATSEQMMASVKSCLATVNPHMKGPNGEKISLRALTPSEAEDQLPRGERPAVEKINIRPDGIAIDSQNFTGNADCATITHELLHHLGLCDEYKETRTNVVSGMSRSRAEEWSCRNVPTRTSIMKNHVEAFNAAIPQQFTCECLSDACRGVMSSKNSASEAQKKILMTANSGSVLRNYNGNCIHVYQPTTTTLLPDPDKAYVDVVASGGRLTFQQRSIFASGNQLLTSRANVTCTCPAGDADCPAEFAKAAETLRGNPQAESCPYIMKPVSEKSAATPGAVSAADSDSFTIVSTPTMPSLITPNHFDKILTGSCKTSSSSLFKQCSEYAYVSQDSAACATKPAACSDDNQFLGVNPQ